MIRRIFRILAEQWKAKDRQPPSSVDDRTSMADFVRILREADAASAPASEK